MNEMSYNDYLKNGGWDHSCINHKIVKKTRVKRGLYQNKEGNLFNADLIGAGNILRKKFPETFSKITDFSFLQNIKVIQVFS